MQTRQANKRTLGGATPPAGSGTPKRCKSSGSTVTAATAYIVSNTTFLKCTLSSEPPTVAYYKVTKSGSLTPLRTAPHAPDKEADAMGRTARMGQAMLNKVVQVKWENDKVQVETGCIQEFTTEPLKVQVDESRGVHKGGKGLHTCAGGGAPMFKVYLETSKCDWWFSYETVLAFAAPEDKALMAETMGCEVSCFLGPSRVFPALV